MSLSLYFATYALDLLVQLPCTIRLGVPCVGERFKTSACSHCEQMPNDASPFPFVS